jgi:cysteine sulfinate desulfinase/cysteine desulfurase-like protein
VDEANETGIMTTRLPFTQASLRRAIAAARKEGLQIVGIRPDGILITAPAGESSAAAIATLMPNSQSEAASKWADVEA